MRLKQGKQITFQSDNDNDNLLRYFTEVRNYGGLTKEEEWDLIYNIQNGNDKVSLDKLIKHNAKFVISIAKHYQGMGTPILDLISFGNEGMIEAAYRFNLKKKIKFFSYAIWWIRNKMYLNINTHKRVIQLPQNRWILCDDVKREIINLEYALGRIPTLEELTDSLNNQEVSKLTKNKKKKANIYSQDDVLQALSHASHNTSLQDTLNDDDDILESIIPSPETIDQDDTVNSLHIDLNSFLYKLCQFEYDVLVLSLGLNSESPLNTADIAKALGMREKEVVNLKVKAVKKLKRASNIDFLKQYL